MDKKENLREISDSILSSVKQLLGVPIENESFDLDIMLNINAASSRLFQLGVLEKPYTITTNEDMYDDLPIPGRSEDIANQIKMYFFYKTKLVFDNSTLSAAVIEVIKEEIKEAEWRIKEAVELKDAFE